MTLLRSATGTATRSRRPKVVPGDAAGTAEAHATADSAISARDEREIAFLARRLHERHLDVSMAEMTSIVEHEYMELAHARVQGFRMILTERAVRRRLEHLADIYDGPLTDENEHA